LKWNVKQVYFGRTIHKSPSSVYHAPSKQDQGGVVSSGSEARAEAREDHDEARTLSVEEFPPIGDESACLHWLWTTLYAPDGVSTVCRHCRVMRRFHRVTKRRAYACDHCGTQVYPTAGTFMQGSGLGIATWFAAAWELMEGDPGVAPRTLADELDVSYKTALRVKRKLEEALTPGSADADLLERLRADAGGPGTAAAGVPARERASRARENIRAAACRAFAARGPSATRIADIAREAGVSSAIIHYYYKSKDEVLLAALQWANEHTSSALHELRQETSDPVELLRRTIDLAIPSEGVLRDEYVLWIETWARVRLHPRLLGECAAMSEGWVAYFQELVEDGEAAGVFKPTAPADEIAQRMVALSDGLSFRSAVGYTGMQVQRVRELLVSFAAEQLGVPVAALAER
jgi:AcrR family transcriptional regulator